MINGIVTQEVINMPNTPNNRPAGRRRTGGGAGQSVSTHGAGMGTGPVGKADAYAGRTGQQQSAGSGGGDRGSGLFGGSKSKLIIIVLAAILLFGGGGKLLFGGSNNGETPSSQNTNQGSSQGSSLIGSLLGGLSGGFTGNGSYSSGWTGEDNTGRLNTDVSSQARAKRTTILGGGRDVVTLMVYVCGTDLESKSGMASSDLKEMASADISDKVNLIVYTGGCKQWKTSGISNTTNQIYKVENGQLKTLVKSDGSAAMTAPSTLTGFINYCKKNYPANRNALILWDHGGGTLSGYGYDEKNVSAGSMTLSGLNQALKATGMTFDFIGFDACLMATLETALVMDQFADYLIASEETEPGIGWYYTNWLNQLSSNTSTSTLELGKTIVDDFVSVCAQKCPGQKATLSVIDLAELSATAGNALADFSSSTADLISGSGYKEISQARSDTKEFASSNKIDQIDLVHLALNIGTTESKNLAETLLSAVKYNKVSSSITNAYGLSAYFPYRSANKVNSAVKQLDAIGFDDEYTDCVKKFASLEVTGQAVQGGSAGSLSSLFGSLTGTGSGSSSALNPADIIGSLLGGAVGGSSGSGSSSAGIDLTSLLGGLDIFDRSLEQDELISLVENNTIDNDALVWTKEGDLKVLKLTEKQWSLVSNLLLNVFLDDGKGYIDLGLDNIFSWTEDGDLVGAYDNMWIALNSQPVAYYFVDETDTDDGSVITGRIPILLNGDRAELIVVFEDDKPSIAGVRFIYADGETDTVAKADAELQEGDVIQPICDRYTYDGKYEDTYKLGDEIVVDGKLKVSDVELNPADGKPVATYMLTDIFNVEHWTPKID